MWDIKLTDKPTRRAFLTGAAIANPIRQRASAVAAREYVHFARRAMACEFSVFFPADTGSAVAARRSISAIDALDLVDALESQLSIYRDDSEVSQLNRRGNQEAVVVERRLFELLRRAQELSLATGGAFDITAGPLSRVWGFHQRQPRIPAAEEIEKAMLRVGSDQLILDASKSSVRFATDGLEINLGAIGKGYALDRCAESLTRAGEPTFLIHGGKSSVLARCDPNATGWRVDLRSPTGGQVLVSLNLTNHAMATSGDAVQRIQIEDKTYGHIIDPRSGRPADGLVSATAFAKTASDADALATAFYLMGHQATAELCQTHQGVGAILISPHSGEDQVRCFGAIPDRRS